MFQLRRTVYLDNNATTPVSKSVQKRMAQVLAHCYGNPSSLYQDARDAAMVLQESRETVARAINADPAEITFTGSATEANNNVLVCLAEHFAGKRGKIVSLPTEHASVLGTLDYLKTRGVAVEYCPVDDMGFARLDELEKLVDENTFLVCCMLANNETGVLQDVARVCELAHRKGALVLSDCVQALGKVPLDVGSLGIDYATYSAHKVHGPKGAGALYVKNGAPHLPFIHGGHQESGLRAGTESLHNIAGLACAFEDVPCLLKHAATIQGLRDRLVAGLRNIKPDIAVNSPEQRCLPNTASVTFPGIANAVLMAELDYYGIAVSAGSACNTQSDEPSHVLAAIGLTPDQARQTVRFSLSDRTTARDVRYALRAVANIVSGKSPAIAMISPAQLDQKILFDPSTYILDVRFWYDRLAVKGLPGAHESSFPFISRYVGKLPRDRNILVVCQAGANAPMVAYYLRSKGFRRLSFLMAGMVGWKAARPDLYLAYAGRDIAVITP